VPALTSTRAGPPGAVYLIAFPNQVVQYVPEQPRVDRHHRQRPGLDERRGLTRRPQVGSALVDHRLDHLPQVDLLDVERGVPAVA
jgi:hypothetical protein